MKPTRIRCPECGECYLQYSKATEYVSTHWTCLHHSMHFFKEDLINYIVNDCITIDVKGKTLFIDIVKAIELSKGFF